MEELFEQLGNLVDQPNPIQPYQSRMVTLYNIRYCIPQKIEGLLSLLELVAELRPRPPQEALKVDGERSQVWGDQPPRRHLLGVSAEDIFAVIRDLWDKCTIFGFRFLNLRNHNHTTSVPEFCLLENSQVDAIVHCPLGCQP